MDAAERGALGSALASALIPAKSLQQSADHRGHLNSTEGPSSMKLDSSIAAVVTGGASGLGGATVRALAAHGVQDRHPRPRTAARKKARRSPRKSAASSVRQRHFRGRGRLRPSTRPAPPTARSGSVNCAHRPTRPATVSRDRNTGEVRRFATEAFNMIIQINLVGTFRCISKSAAGMLSLDPLPDGDRGAIVNTASVAAEDGQIGQAGLYGVQGRRRRPDAGGRPRPFQENIRCNTIPARHLDTPLLAGAPEPVGSRRCRPRCPSPSGGVAHGGIRLAGAGTDPQRHSQRRRHPPRRAPSACARVEEKPSPSMGRVGEGVAAEPEVTSAGWAPSPDRLLSHRLRAHLNPALCHRGEGFSKVGVPTLVLARIWRRRKRVGVVCGFLAVVHDDLGRGFVCVRFV